MEIVVTRRIDNGRETLGQMNCIGADGQHLVLCTLELPWQDNHNEVSCIPKGTYSVAKISPSANIPYEHFAIQNVPSRSGVCIHAANYVSQLRGCIAVGLAEGDINGDGLLDITSSQTALKKLLDFLPAECSLQII